MSNEPAQLDIFRAAYADIPIRDQRDTMERPFFSLAKKPRRTPIEYSVNGVTVKVTPGEYGIATIWDADILIWAATQITEALDREGKASRTIHFHPYQLLKGIHRRHGGDQYRKLLDALRRLRTTDVETNIRPAHGRTKRGSFGWIDAWTVEESPDGDPVTMTITLSEWLFQGIIEEGGILSIHEDYFLLTGGIERWLGYPGREFSIETFFRILHPQAARLMYLTTANLFRIACSGSYPLDEKLDLKYVTLIPLRHYDGHYLTVKKVSSVYEYDNRNRLFSYLNEFTIIGPFNPDKDTPSLKPRISDISGTEQSNLENQVGEALVRSFLSLKIFSRGELGTLQYLAHNPASTQRDIAESSGLSVHTIDTYYKRSLAKAREAFQHDFANVVEVAYFLKQMGLF